MESRFYLSEEESCIVLPHKVAVQALKHTNSDMRREINFRHVAQPLNLLILMAEVFFSLCLFFFFLSVFLAALSRAGAKAARQALRQSDLPLYLCGISTPLPPHTLPSLSPCLQFFTALCLCELVPVPLFNYHTS